MRNKIERYYNESYIYHFGYTLMNNLIDYKINKLLENEKSKEIKELKSDSEKANYYFDFFYQLFYHGEHLLREDKNFNLYIKNPYVKNKNREIGPNYDLFTNNKYYFKDLKLSDYLNLDDLNFLLNYIKKEKDKIIFNGYSGSTFYRYNNSNIISRFIHFSDLIIHPLFKNILFDTFACEDYNVIKIKKEYTKYSSYKSFLMYADDSYFLEIKRLENISSFIFILLKNESDKYKITFFELILEFYKLDCQYRKSVCREDYNMFKTDENGNEIKDDENKSFYCNLKNDDKTKELIITVDRIFSNLKKLEKNYKKDGKIDDSWVEGLKKIENKSIFEDMFDDEVEYEEDNDNDYDDEDEFDDIDDDDEIEYEEEVDDDDEVIEVKDIKKIKKEIIKDFDIGRLILKLKENEYIDIEENTVYSKILIRYKDLKYYEDYDKLKERNFYYKLLNMILNYYKDKDEDVYNTLTLKMLLRE